MLRDHRQVARHLALVAATNGHSVDPRYHGLAAVHDALEVRAEEPHVLPVIARPLGVLLLVLLHIAARAEGSVAAPGENDHPYRVIEGGILEGAGQLTERRCGVRVVGVRPIQRDRGDAIALLVQHLAEPEAVRWLRFEVAHRCIPWDEERMGWRPAQLPRDAPARSRFRVGGASAAETKRFAASVNRSW